MARPRKPIHYEEELSRIDAKITRARNTIKELEEDRRSLLQEREQTELAKLYNLCKASGLPINELIRIVSEYSVGKTQSKSA